MVECHLCGAKLNMITSTHLSGKHGITMAEYRQKFPEALLCSEETRVRYRETRYHGGTRAASAPKLEPHECFRPGCHKITTHPWNKYCSSSCSSKHHHALNPDCQRGLSNPSATDGSHAFQKSQKRKARDRDNHVCLACGGSARGKAAHVHHKINKACFDDPFAAHQLDNLITLCPGCHKRIEHESLRELYRRALRLDELSKDEPGHVTLAQFLDGLFPGGSY